MSGSGARVFECDYGVLSVFPDGRWSVAWASGLDADCGALFGDGESCGYAGLLVFLHRLYRDWDASGDDGGNEYVLGRMNETVASLGVVVRSARHYGPGMVGDDCWVRRLSFSFPDVARWRMVVGFSVSLGGSLGDLGVNVDYRSGELWFTYLGQFDNTDVVLGPVPGDDALRDVARIADNGTVDSSGAYGLSSEVMRVLGVGMAGCRVSSDAVAYASRVIGEYSARVRRNGFLGMKNRLVRAYK